MAGTRLIITAADMDLATTAAREFCGNASSVIGCDAEAGIERTLSGASTPDGRPGMSVLAFAFSRKDLEKAVSARVGQNVLTCPTTACYAGLESVTEKEIKLGSILRYFGDGNQISKKFGARRIWRLPVMDGEFIIDDVVGTVKGVGGGNLIATGADSLACLAAMQQAVAKIRELEDVILPFPSGIVRSGSKVGSKYPKLKASTNDAWCPTLRDLPECQLGPEENVAYEIVIDGLSETAVREAMRVGLQSLRNSPAIHRISAGNYGGKLGPFHFRLRDLEDAGN